MTCDSHRTGLAANHSPALERLRASGSLGFNVVSKVSDWNSLNDVRRLSCAASPPLLLHLTLVLGSPTPVNRALPIWHDLRELVPLTRTPYLSAHIGFNCEVGYAPDGTFIFGRRISEDAIIENMKRNADILRDTFGLDLILENQTCVYGGSYVPLYMEGCASPGFLNRALEATGCRLLLDLAHARVNAAYLNVPLNEYLGALPVETAREIHLSGCRVVKNDLLSDEHLELEAADYGLVSQVLRRATPDYLTLEYARDESRLRDQLTRLATLIAQVAVTPASPTRPPTPPIAARRLRSHKR